uniref:Uncharacterized protein n=1 Tax=Arundo donax TaxID=35708 RepID=A0A0A9DLE9_ARUDO
MFVADLVHYKIVGYSTWSNHRMQSFLWLISNKPILLDPTRSKSLPLWIC